MQSHSIKSNGQDKIKIKPAWRTQQGLEGLAAGRGRDRFLYKHYLDTSSAMSFPSAASGMGMGMLASSS